MPGSSYYSSLLNALPKYIKNIANLKVEEEKTEILYYMQVLLDDHEFDEIVHELVSERYSENDKRYTLLYDEYMDQIHTLAMQYVVAQEDEDEEVKKNALIALYNLVGREILDEVANGQNFSDNLKMEAVSMISEYEDENE